MKKISIFLVTLLMLLVLVFNVKAQDIHPSNATWPTYRMEIRNDTLISDRVYEFDLFIKCNSTVDLKLNQIQLGFIYNLGVINGGVILTPTTSQSELIATYSSGAWSVNSNATYAHIRKAFNTSPGLSGFSTLTYAEGWKKLFRIRLENTVAFGQAKPNFNFLLTSITGFTKTSLTAYVGTTSTSITTSNPNPTITAWHINSNLNNPLFNVLPSKYNVSGTGSYCSAGLPVTLSNSEIGVRYQLHKNGIAVDSARIGTGSSIIWQNQTEGVYTVVANRIATYLTDTMNGSASITVSSGTIGSISSIIGSNTVCQGQQNVLFSIPKVNNATNYKWEFSGLNYTFANNYIDTFAILNFANNAASGDLVVKAYDACGDSVSSALFALNVNGLPEIAGVISGSANASPLQSLIYTVPSINGATSYLWNYSGSDVSIVGNTNTVTLNFGASTTSGVLTVKGINSCGEGLVSNGFTINVSSIPAPAGTISGLSSVCPGQNNVMYKIPEIIGADTYLWEYSGTGVTIDSILGDTAFIHFAANATTGNLTVKGHNSFGYGNVSAIFSIIVKPLPASAGLISGNLNPCKNTTNNVYKVLPIANASSYIWTLPSGFNGSSTSDSIIVSLGSAAINGSIVVRGSNSCGVGDSSFISVNVNTIPSAAGIITGPSPVCQGANNLIYKTSIINGATTYLWSLPSGASGSSSSDSISVNFSNSASTGQISVRGQNACGLGIMSSFAVQLSPLPGNAGTITSKLNVCQGQIDTLSIPAVSNVSSYVWTLPLGTTISGSSTLNKIIVNYGNNAVSGNITVKGQNSCGFGNSSTKSVTVNPLPSIPDTIFGISNACKGQSGFVYNVPITLNASSYVWTLPNGATGSSNTDTIIVGFPSGAVSGSISVKGQNSCGFGPIRTKSIIVNDSLHTSNLIVGLNNVCRGQNGISYSINPISGATSYIWTLPNGATGNSNTNSILVNFESSAVSGVITVKGINNCFESNVVSLPINVGFVPDPAGIITGLSTVCNGQNSIVYKVPPIYGATSYSWSLPNGVIGSSIVDSIVVSFNTLNPTIVISVKGVSTCGLGAVSEKNITVNPLPASSGVITGLSSVCEGQNNVVYKVPSIQNAVSYVWTLPNGVLGSSTTDSIVVSFPLLANSGNITVKGLNSCGFGGISSKLVNVNKLPQTVTTINGNSNPCQGLTNVSYSVDSIPYATSYVWTLPNGASGISTTKTIFVNFANNAISGNITVKGENSCGFGPLVTKPITISNLPSAAGLITGLNSVCQGQNTVTYKVPSINNATSYSWILPLGATGVSATDSISINFTSFAVSGKIIVKGQNSCGFGDTSSIYINVNPLPANAGTITGAALICKGQTNLTYSVPTINNATDYIWTFPSGFSLVGSGNNDTIVLNTNMSAVTGPITVKGQNACGFGNQATKNITVNSIPSAPGVIAGNDIVCQGSQNQSYSVNSVSGATSYTWSLPFGASGISTSNNILVGFSSSATSGNIVVKANNVCGSSDTTYKLITVNSPAASAGTITGPTAVCAGATNQTYTVPAIAGATSYTWTLPAGLTGTSTTNSISVDFANNAVAGSISVYGSNSCGDGAPSSLAFTINTVPDAAGTITSVGGDSIVAAGTKTYTVPAISGATSYVWTYSGTGATITGTTNTVNITFVAGFTNGSLTVMGQNSCGNGTVSPAYVITNYVGVDDQNANSLSYSIYPNPTKGKISVEINGVSEKLELQVCNLQGEIIKVQKLANNKQSQTTEIDLSNYAKGIYFVKIINNNFVKVEKVVLQ